jgi:ABC-type lipoprotein export system ATPase subunit
MTPAIVARELFRVYATPEGSSVALQGLNLSVDEGAVVVVLGPSGAGKSTLLRLLAGLEQPSAGTVTVAGADLAKLSESGLSQYRSSTLGFLDQHYSRALDPDLPAHELVSLQLALAGAGKRERGKRADALLERVGLADRRDARPRQLSGGEQQRVAICAALAHRPRVLLADEPTGELDAGNAALVYELLGEVAREENCTALIVSHDQEATTIADRVVHVRDGRVSSESGSADDEEVIVVGRGGGLQLPEEMMIRSGIRSRARAHLADRTIELTAAADTTSAVGPEPVAATSLTVATRRRRADGRVVATTMGATKYYAASAATPALAPLDARFEAGKLTAVTGPSGSGKTTLLLLLAGLEAPTAGTIDVDGHSLAELDREARAKLRRERIGFIPQQFDLVPFMTATENVELSLTLRGLNGAEARERASRSLEDVGVHERAGQRVSRLSAGERQRVSIACAVAAAPALLLADEPTARLDKANATAVGSMLAHLAAEFDTAVVCATHDPVVIEHADREIALGVHALADAARSSASSLTSP